MYDYSQPVSPSGDVFGYGVKSLSMTVYRGPQTAAGSRTCFSTSLIQQDNQNPPYHHCPYSRTESLPWGRCHPAASWPSSIPSSPSRHSALLRAPQHCRSQLTDIIPSSCPGHTSGYTFFEKWAERARKCFQRLRETAAVRWSSAQTEQLDPRVKIRWGWGGVFFLLVPQLYSSSNWLLFFKSPVCSLCSLSCSCTVRLPLPSTFHWVIVHWAVSH